MAALPLNCVVDDFLWPWQRPTPVVMLHGFARNARFWNRWVPAIAEARRVYRPELPGCGGSPPPPDGFRYTPESMAESLIALFDQLALPRVHWVGESSGGLVGLLLAASHPQRIASLVLCNTPTRISDEIRQIYALGHADTAAAIRALGTGEWCRRTLGYRLDLDRAGPEIAAWCIAEMGKTRVDLAAAMHECFESVDVAPLLPLVAAPALLLSGDKSRIAAAAQQVLAARLPHGRLDLFEGVGHGVNLIEPERCAEKALAFWRQIEAA
jgi:pimeloyl-ACP methyl ester carboxylesterase